MNELVISVAVALVLAVVALYYAAARAAFGVMTLSWAERLVDEEVRGSRRVLRLLQHEQRTRSGLAVLVALPAAAAITLVVPGTAAALPLWAAALIALGAGVVLLAAVFEVVPAIVGARGPDRVASATALVVDLSTRVVAPLALLVSAAVRLALPRSDHAPSVTEESIRDLVDSAEEAEAIEARERAMIHSIFELGDTLVREIMVPRPDVAMVGADATLATVVDIVVERGYSRIPVHAADDREKLVGLLYAKDVLGRLHAGGTEDEHCLPLVREPYVVPELKHVDTLLRELQQAKVHMALVVDEYGSFTGIVTIEDIIEEIVGEIEDEYDAEEVLVEMAGEGEWVVDGRLPVDDLDEIVDTELPDEEWDTVGGLLYGVLGHVPRTGEVAEVAGVRLTAERMQGRRVAKVRVRLVRSEELSGADG